MPQNPPKIKIWRMRQPEALVERWQKAFGKGYRAHNLALTLLMMWALDNPKVQIELRRRAAQIVGQANWPDEHGLDLAGAQNSAPGS